MAGAENDRDNAGNPEHPGGDSPSVGGHGGAQRPAGSALEVWKDIKGWPYQVSNMGRMRRVHIVTPIKTSKTYSRVQLSRGRNNTTPRTTETERAFFVHRLVAEAFIGPCPPGKSHVAHRDGNPQNNTLENLYWATPKENAADRMRHGKYKNGEGHAMARISDDDARIIRAWFHFAGETIAAIARRFMVNETVIRNVVRGRTYQSAGGYGT